MSTTETPADLPRVSTLPYKDQPPFQRPESSRIRIRNRAHHHNGHSHSHSHSHTRTHTHHHHRSHHRPHRSHQLPRIGTEHLPQPPSSLGDLFSPVRSAASGLSDSFNTLAARSGTFGEPGRDKEQRASDADNSAMRTTAAAMPRRQISWGTVERERRRGDEGER